MRALHLISEASRLAFADRARYVADPAFVSVPIQRLVSPSYIAERRRPMKEDRPMDPPGHLVPPGYVEKGTSHITIVDKYGSAVAFTMTIESSFGAGIMLRGFVLNNELTDFAAVPEINSQLAATASSRANGHDPQCRLLSSSVVRMD